MPNTINSNRQATYQGGSPPDAPMPAAVETSSTPPGESAPASTAEPPEATDSTLATDPPHPELQHLGQQDSARNNALIALLKEQKKINATFLPEGFFEQHTYLMNAIKAGNSREARAVIANMHHLQAIQQGNIDQHLEKFLEKKLHSISKEGTQKSGSIQATGAFEFTYSEGNKGVTPAFQSIFSIQDENGDTALMAAIRAKNRSIAGQLADLMSPEDLNIQGKSGHTALMIALHKDDGSIVKDLVKKMNKTGLGLQDPSGNTALMISARSKGFITARYIQERMDAEDFNIQNKSGQTALIIAALEKQAFIVKDLAGVMNRQGLGLQDLSGDTALMISARSNGFITTGYIIERMPAEDLNQQNNSGETALMIAVQKRETLTIHYLIKRMSKDQLSIADQAGRTALDIANELGDSSIARKLQEKIDS